jgi:hypothetical protein
MCLKKIRDLEKERNWNYLWMGLETDRRIRLMKLNHEITDGEAIWNPETILVCAFGGGWFMEREVWRNQAKMEWDE